jgi:hypothetical protein
MPSTPKSVHLNNHHRNTLAEILQHPVGRNIEWRDVLSLLEVVASVEEENPMVVATASRIGQFPPGRDGSDHASSRAQCQVSGDTAEESRCVRD